MASSKNPFSKQVASERAWRRERSPFQFTRPAVSFQDELSEEAIRQIQEEIQEQMALFVPVARESSGMSSPLAFEPVPVRIRRNENYFTWMLMLLKNDR